MKYRLGGDLVGQIFSCFSYKRVYRMAVLRLKQQEAEIGPAWQTVAWSAHEYQVSSSSFAVVAGAADRYQFGTDKASKQHL